MTEPSHPPAPDLSFATRLLAWFDRHGRKDLPWQRDINAYRVWLSEIMLQQTQVATVIPYFQRFTAQYPRVEDLARAPLDDVLHLWTGLGYYARARNLHKAARRVMEDFGGEFPADMDALCSLPGIGRSTAGAIASIAFGQRAAILDGNVKRVLARHQAVDGWPGETAVHRRLWEIAEDCTPDRRFGDYTQAIMDLGATLCTRTRPRCEACPVSSDCRANASGEQALFPGKKPRKSLPVRQAQWLVLINADGETLLERRPGTGLWGGLWTFPEAEGKPAGKPLPQRRHTFSHFHLDYTPVIQRVKAADSIADGDNRAWVHPANLAGRGTPAPVKRLLDELATMGDNLLASPNG